jgi:uncharacterized protein YecE (DUF72 family)
MGGPARIHIGTSGWHYGHWRGPFYPEDLPQRRFLEYYMARFHTVEINNSFYQLPKAETLILWRDTVPQGFVFTAKASRYITHMKKLKDPEESLAKFLERVAVLGRKLGPILFQLPPKWRMNLERIREFLAALPPDHRYAFEFRDQSWYRPEVYEALSEYQTAFCIYELAGHLSPKQVTADFVYIRLHGPGNAYQGRYEPRVLAGWAGAVSAWARQGKDVFFYFDNDEAGYAVQDAARLQEMLA